MKKLIAILMVAMMAILPAAARDKVYHSSSVLPATAQQTIKANFPKATVNRVKVDSNVWGQKDYEVVLSNGAEIDFDKEGNWKEVDCGHSAVPGGFVIAQIKNYVEKNHKGQAIVKIDKERNSYDLELSNGMELKFDRSGKFLRYDD